ncbi:MAG TPA: right-handed parallel beta-helix repeat-containing protein [Ktedonobacterales bacterium]|nr:right-handed parallel beta-helix repeat-containing protein [Ktedonobacterales bacterium]
MKKRVFVIVGAVVGIAVLGLAALGIAMATHAPSASAATACTATGYVRDGKNLTAALINPSGTVSGDLDATGCDIGVFYGAGATGMVSGADIHNAKYFGVVNDGGAVTVENSRIHEIGESPFNGAQHGVAVYWVFGSAATGKIVNNTIWNYQKGGIAVNGVGSSATISGNTVTGLGPVSFIAQNGIQVGFGATGTVMGNTVSDNSYTGTSTQSGGILVAGGDCYGGPYTTDTEIVGNTVINNDVGIWMSNIQGDCVSAPTTATNIKVANNTISNDAVNNGYVYQAGISDQGYNDKIVHNTISGAGYGPEITATVYLIPIDASGSFTNKVKVHANAVS